MSDARFNPAPDWPTPPAGWTPPPGWQPDPSWPPAPPGWNLWLNADGSPASAPAGAPTVAAPAAPTSMAPTPAVPYASSDAGASPYAGAPGTASEADVQAAIKQLRSGGLRSILFGAVAIVVGIGVTIWSASQSSGGRVWYGIILVGIVVIIRGIIQAATAEKKVRTHLGVPPPAPSGPQPGQWPGAR